MRLECDFCIEGSVEDQLPHPCSEHLLEGRDIPPKPWRPFFSTLQIGRFGGEGFLVNTDKIAHITFKYNL